MTGPAASVEPSPERSEAERDQKYCRPCATEVVIPLSVAQPERDDARKPAGEAHLPEVVVTFQLPTLLGTGVEQPPFLTFQLPPHPADFRHEAPAFAKIRLVTERDESLRE